MAGQGVGFSELPSSSNGSDNTKRPGIPQITPSELVLSVNLQRIAQRKAQNKTYPVRKKLEKLGVYSSCKAEESCNCNGWRDPNPPPTPSRVDLSQPLANLTDPCRACSHTLGAHISHLHDIPEDELNRLLCMVIDVENVFMCVHREEDADTKQVYFYLFRLLRRGILQMATVTVEGPLGTPPFEKPSIGKAVLNFVLYKFGHLPQREWQIMRDLARMFLDCLNHCKLETPTQKKLHSQGEDLAAYKQNYTRWLCYCWVPVFCDSLKRHDLTAVFGRGLLRSVFSVMTRKLLELFRAGKGIISPDKRTIILTHFPRFLSMLEEEVYGDNSPIWDDDFTVPQSLSLDTSRTRPLTPLPKRKDFLVATERKRNGSGAENDGSLGTDAKRQKLTDLIPAFVRARGDKALAAYHRAIETGGSTYDKRVKVLLVGQDRVGKTSLGRALRGEPFNEAELSTEGVQMIPAIKNAGTGAWKNPSFLEHTTVFDHKVAAKTAEDLLSKHSEQPADKRPRIEASNKTDQLFVQDENPISSKADEGKPQLLQQEEASREVKEKADEGKTQVLQQEEASREVKENEAQKNQDQDLENQKKPFGVPDEIAIILEKHLEKNEGNADEKIWPIIWDFAGQDIYRSIHPIFMSSYDIYLLVFDLTKKLSEKAECRVNVRHKERTATARDSEDTNLDHLFRWMDLIHSLKTDFQSDGLSYPPVILVGTHADCVDDPRQAIKSVVEEKCSSVFDEYTYLPHIADCLPIDNTKSGKSADQEEISELRKKILELADKMPHTKREIPLQWHRVEKEIRQPVWQKQKYLQKESFRKDIVSHHCTFESEDDFDELVYFLHDRGTIVYHEHEQDKQKFGLIVLDPQWLINVLCEIIKVEPDQNEPLCLRQDRKKLAKEGVLRERLIDYTCKKKHVCPIKDSFISLMDKFNLICKWPEKTKETKTGESQILVPCMLTTYYKEEGKNETDNASAIYLTFQTKYVPSGLFCRLVVLFGKTPHFKNMRSLCANEAKIALDNENHVLQLLCYKAVIKLQIFADHGSTPPQELYDLVLSQLNEFLKKLRNECHWLHLMSETLSARCTVCMGKETEPCARHEKSSCWHHDCGHYIPLDGRLLCCEPGHMLVKEPLIPWIRAIEHVSKNLNLSSSYPKSHDESWSLQEETLEEKGRKKKQRSPELEEEIKDEMVVDYDLEGLSTELGVSWKPLARRLEFGEAEIEGFDHDNKELREKCYRMLHTWKRKKASSAAYLVLYEALCHEHVGRKDLAVKYCISESTD